MSSPTDSEPEIVTHDLVHYPTGVRRHSTVDVKGYEEQVLQGRSLFTRAFIEAASHRLFALQREMGAGFLVWERTSTLASRFELDKSPIVTLPQVALMKEFVQVNDWPTQQQLMTLRDEWTNSWACADLRKIVRLWADQMSRVKQLVCFGLGKVEGSLFPNELADCFGGDGNDRHLKDRQRSCAIQHMMAVTIADTLTAYYKTKWALDENMDTPILIMLQDPRYSTKDEWLLQTTLSPQIVFVGDPDGFLEIDENTFVFSFCCPAPVYEIAADLTVSGACGGGPAGFLGNEIGELRDWNGTAKHDSWETPRVSEFLSRYHMADFEGLAMTKEEYLELWNRDPFIMGMQMRFRKA